MDERDLIRSFRRDDVSPNPVARDAARRRLMEHIAERCVPRTRDLPAQASTEDLGTWQSSALRGSLGERIARDGREMVSCINPSHHMASAPHSDTRYELETLREFGAGLLSAALLGEIGVTSVAGLSRRFQVPPALVRTLLQQPDYRLPDGRHRLNFLAEVVVRVQARQLAAEQRAAHASGLVWVRTQPTCPLEGIHSSYAGEYAFGLEKGRRAGAFDSVFATFETAEGREESISFGGLVQALDKDRISNPIRHAHLSSLQRLSLTRPSSAMFMHAGAIFRAVAQELPASSANASLHMFLQGHSRNSDQDATWLGNPTRTMCIVDEPGYQRAARIAFGDDADLIVQAEGSWPNDRGLEVRHRYVRANGMAVANQVVRAVVGDHMQYWRLDSDELFAEAGDLGVVLLPGELRADRPDGRHDAGQALLVINKEGHARWFSILHKADGSRAWTREESQLRARLQRVADAFAMLEGPTSTAGRSRREQFESLRLFDVPMSNPSGRENVWRIAAAARQFARPETFDLMLPSWDSV